MNQSFYMPYVVLAIILTAMFTPLFISKKSELTQNVEYSDYERQVILDVQAWRVGSHRDLYMDHKILCEFAEKRAKEIKNDWSHAGYKKISAKIRKESGFSRTAENLSRNFQNPENVLPAWIKSDSHRSILESNYTHSCIRCNETHCAHLFGAF